MLFYGYFKRNIHQQISLIYQNLYIKKKKIILFYWIFTD